MESEDGDGAEESGVETYWGHCTTGDGVTKITQANAPWRLVYEEGKGYSARSTKSYLRGDVICREKPVTWCHGWHPFTNEQINQIKGQVDQLPINERKAFHQMANVLPEIEEKSIGIYMTNSFDMVGAEQPSCGMYLVCFFFPSFFSISSLSFSSPCPSLCPLTALSSVVLCLC